MMLQRNLDLRLHCSCNRQMVEKLIPQSIEVTILKGYGKRLLFENGDMQCAYYFLVKSLLKSQSFN